MDKLYIVMPAYNEEANIEEVVSSWYKVLSECGQEGSKLVVADSGSKDRTHEILLDLKKKHPNIEILEDTITTHGPKLIAMYNYAISDGADYVFQTDSDGQTNPLEFKKFWDLRGKYDVLIGKRRVREDGFSRKIVEVVLCMILFAIFGVRVPDSNAPFRLMKSSVLKKYMPRFEEDYNLPNVMLTTFYAKYKENMNFLDITFRPRQGGKNSLNIMKITKIGIKALSDFYGFKKSM